MQQVQIFISKSLTGQTCDTRTQVYFANCYSLEIDMLLQVCRQYSWKYLHGLFIFFRIIWKIWKFSVQLCIWAKDMTSADQALAPACLCCWRWLAASWRHRRDKRFSVKSTTSVLTSQRKTSRRTAPQIVTWRVSRRQDVCQWICHLTDARVSWCQRKRQTWRHCSQPRDGAIYVSVKRQNSETLRWIKMV